MSAASLHVAHDGPVSRLTLARPARRNALDAALLAALTQALTTLPPQCRVVVLAGEGASFCAGADLQWMQAQGRDAAATNDAGTQALANLFAAVVACPQAVLAVVHGPVRGGGCGLVAAADVAVCSDDASFAFSELRLGLIPAVIAPYVIARLGAAQARALFLTAEVFAAPRALALGLVHEVVPAGALAERAAAVTAQLVAAGPEARRALKSLLAELSCLPAAAQPAAAARALAQVRAGAEAQEGLAAFFARRSPSWSAEAP